MLRDSRYLRSTWLWGVLDAVISGRWEMFVVFFLDAVEEAELDVVVALLRVRRGRCFVHGRPRFGFCCFCAMKGISSESIDEERRFNGFCCGARFLLKKAFWRIASVVGRTGLLKRSSHSEVGDE